MQLQIQRARNKKLTAALLFLLMFFLAIYLLEKKPKGFFGLIRGGAEKVKGYIESIPAPEEKRILKIREIKVGEANIKLEGRGSIGIIRNITGNLELKDYSIIIDNTTKISGERVLIFGFKGNLENASFSYILIAGSRIEGNILSVKNYKGIVVNGKVDLLSLEEYSGNISITPLLQEPVRVSNWEINLSDLEGTIVYTPYLLKVDGKIKGYSTKFQ